MAVAQFRTSYPRGAKLQGGLAVVGTLAAVGAWLGGAPIGWLGGGRAPGRRRAVHPAGDPPHEHAAPRPSPVPRLARGAPVAGTLGWASRRAHGARPCGRGGDGAPPGARMSPRRAHPHRPVCSRRRRAQVPRDDGSHRAPMSRPRTWRSGPGRPLRSDPCGPRRVARGAPPGDRHPRGIERRRQVLDAERRGGPGAAPTTARSGSGASASTASDPGSSWRAA